MIQIRTGMYETNSSSCHVFSWGPDNQVNVPTFVELVPESSDSLLNILFNDYYCWYDPSDKYDSTIGDIVGFIDTLYELGVKTIKCSDQNIQKMIDDRKDSDRSDFMYNNVYISRFDKELLSNAVFGNKTNLDTFEDHDLDSELDNKYGKSLEGYFAIRLS